MIKNFAIVSKLVKWMYLKFFTISIQSRQILMMYLRDVYFTVSERPD